MTDGVSCGASCGAKTLCLVSLPALPSLPHSQWTDYVAILVGVESHVRIGGRARMTDLLREAGTTASSVPSRSKTPTRAVRTTSANRRRSRQCGLELVTDDPLAFLKCLQQLILYLPVADDKHLVPGLQNRCTRHR